MKQWSNVTIYLGVDWGEKRIGLAKGDSQSGVAVPWGVVNNLEKVLKTAKEEEIDKLVIGVPYKMASKDIELNPRFKSFLKELKQKIDKPVITTDEQLTSKAADDLQGSKKNKAPRDALAAMLILQQYLDS